MNRILVLIAGLLSFSVVAQGTSGYVNISDNKMQIIAGSTPRVYVYNVAINNSGCEGQTSTPVLLMDNIVAKEIYAMLLAAKTTGKKVNFVTEGCWYNNTFPTIYSVYFYD